MITFYIFFFEGVSKKQKQLLIYEAFESALYATSQTDLKRNEG